MFQNPHGKTRLMMLPVGSMNYICFICFFSEMFNLFLGWSMEKHEKHTVYHRWIHFKSRNLRNYPAQSSQSQGLSILNGLDLLRHQRDRRNTREGERAFWERFLRKMVAQRVRSLDFAQRHPHFNLPPFSHMAPCKNLKILRLSFPWRIKKY